MYAGVGSCCRFQSRHECHQDQRSDRAGHDPCAGRRCYPKRHCFHRAAGTVNTAGLLPLSFPVCQVVNTMQYVWGRGGGCLDLIKLYAVCCMLYAVCCVMYAVCGVLYAVCCMLYAVCCMLYAVCCMLYAVCCMLYAVCCMLYAVCCMLYAVCPSSCRPVNLKS